MLIKVEHHEILREQFPQWLLAINNKEDQYQIQTEEDLLVLLRACQKLAISLVSISLTDVTEEVTIHHAKPANIHPPIMCGMTPVKLHPSGDGFMSCSQLDPDWYRFIPQVGETGLSHWPNAVAADGSEFVWIPRYAYIENEEKIGEKLLVKFHVIFVDTNDQDEKGNKIPPGYKVPASFTKQNVALSGFWVGKYAASKSQQGNVQIKPGKKILTHQNNADKHYAAFKMVSFPTYGFQNLKQNEIQLTKQEDWYTILCLAHSQYGIQGSFIVENETFIAGGMYANEYVGNVTQSTTHNMTGVFDVPGQLRIDAYGHTFHFCEAFHLSNTFRMCIFPC